MEKRKFERNNDSEGQLEKDKINQSSGYNIFSKCKKTEESKGDKELGKKKRRNVIKKKGRKERLEGRRKDARTQPLDQVQCASDIFH